MSCVKEHYDFISNLGKESGSFEVVVTCLVGSQNYGLADEHSDIDTVSIVVPSFQKMVFNNDISGEYKVGDGLAKIKTIQQFVMKELRSQSFTALELLSTDYYIVNPIYSKVWNRLRENQELISNYDLREFALHTYGYFRELFKKMYNPNLANYNKELGYNTKMAAMILFMGQVFKKRLVGNDWNHSFVADNPNYLLKVKRGQTKYKENIEEMIKTYNEWINEYDFPPRNEEVYELLKSVVYQSAKICILNTMTDGE